ncbi:MAG TPA: hypothetical protein VG146_05405 [Verrucomicrobiae bacterium]|nr:hypothetical protein [Verrucomicrobiae bacterium]
MKFLVLTALPVDEFAGPDCVRTPHKHVQNWLHAPASVHQF